ncbi:MAG: homoserine kinase [Halobacteriovoraceae bacterium]|nr:homoserine kinase [Halobacteriovoraceae bacterium]|tara:strand:+ start:1578 stop:2525 length:948 start_codon:yes stop_codon:yes gene_type:complete
MKENDRLSITCFSPATLANLAVGFDFMGVAVSGFGDTVTVTKIEEPTVRFDYIEGPDSQDLPVDPFKNTASYPLVKMREEFNLDFGFSLGLKKGIPLSSGLGGSASSACGAVLAANKLLPSPLKKEELLNFALQGEAKSSGIIHGDNVIPCLFGGLNLIFSLNPLSIKKLPIHEDFVFVVWHPHFRVDTLKARSVLSKTILLDQHTNQSIYLSGFLIGLYENNYELMNQSLKDVIVEPQRKKLIPYFDEIQKKAYDFGGYNLSISGAGPSLFALARGKENAEKLKDEVDSFFKEKGEHFESFISSVNEKGTYYVD